jgi:hypothetical protein
MESRGGGRWAGGDGDCWRTEAAKEGLRGAMCEPCAACLVVGAHFGQQRVGSAAPHGRTQRAERSEWMTRLLPW